MSWRPDDWENEWSASTVGNGAFEAGADLMLEALKARGERLEAKDTLRDTVNLMVSIYKPRACWLVCIPED